MMSNATSRRDTLRWIVAGALVATSFATRGADAFKGNSIYQLRPALTDQDGQPFDLGSLRGSTVVASMFYSTCDKVCPMIFETIQQTVRTLAASDRDAVRVLMVSFDPARDSVAALRQTANAHGCDTRWTLVRADERDVRKLAAVLGVQYRRLSNGEFNHSSGIELLDSEGRVIARTGTLGAVDAQFARAIRQSLKPIA